MKRTLGGIQRIALPLFIILVYCSGLTGCTIPSNGAETRSGSEIDWVNFIRFGGIQYIAAQTRPGRSLTRDDLGPVFKTVAFKLDGNVHDPGYQSKDGDAAFLAAGTNVYIVKGYSATFRLAAYANTVLTLYEADTNPHANKGADLLDIGGKVQFIGIASEQDGVTELSAIKDARQVAALVKLVLEAPVNQTLQAGSQQYFLAFHLVDGTVATRAYWLDTDEMARGIILPSAFGLAIKAALPTT